MDEGRDVSRDTVMLTYEELAARLGIDVQSARRRALRHRWPKTKGNDGRARVAVPATVLPATGATVAGASATSHAPVLPTPIPGVAVTPEILSRLLSQGDELTELRERVGRAEGEAAALRDVAAHERNRANAEQERAARAEGERDALHEALRVAQATAEEAGRRAKAAEERAAAAHQRAAEVTTGMGRVAEGLEQIRQTQATAAGAIAGAVAAAKAEREAALARVREAEARTAEAAQRAEAAEARLDELQRLPAEAAAADTVELEAARARAAEAERQAAEARRRADEAERRATTANERWDRFQQKRIAEAREAAMRAVDTPQVASPAAEVRPLWHRIFRRRGKPS